jgi:hypothetical protein
MHASTRIGCSRPCLSNGLAITGSSWLGRSAAAAAAPPSLLCRRIYPFSQPQPEPSRPATRRVHTAAGLDGADAALGGDASGASSSGTDADGGAVDERQAAPWEPPVIPTHVLERNAKLKVCVAIMA